MAELKPCPFCGGNNIGYSIKTTTIQFKRAYHFSMYCKDCNCYGARTLWKCDTNSINRVALERNEDFKQNAIKAWNTRTPKERGGEK